MQKRIGTRFYDTEKSEMICEITNGKLYRKRTRDREWFAVFDNGAIRPLDINHPRDKKLIEIGLPYVEDETLPESTSIRIDRETLTKINTIAKMWKCSVSEVVKRLVKQFLLLTHLW